MLSEGWLPSPDKPVLAVIVLGWLCLVPREDKMRPRHISVHFWIGFTCLEAETIDSRALVGFIKVHGTGSAA